MGQCFPKEVMGLHRVLASCNEVATGSPEARMKFSSLPGLFRTFSHANRLRLHLHTSNPQPSDNGDLEQFEGEPRAGPFEEYHSPRAQRGGSCFRPFSNRLDVSVCRCPTEVSCGNAFQQTRPEGLVKPRANVKPRLCTSNLALAYRCWPSSAALVPGKRHSWTAPCAQFGQCLLGMNLLHSIDQSNTAVSEE